jgi:ABC-type transporter Mla subunit MlaD
MMSFVERITVRSFSLTQRLASTILLFLLLGTAVTVAAQSIDDTADSLDTAISDLQASRDDLESYEGAADDDLAGATQAVREARHTMRSTAISLLISSLDHAPEEESRRTMAALKLLEPRLFEERGPAAREP